MSAGPTERRPALTSAIWRALWGSMVLCHAPAFLVAWRSLVAGGFDLGVFAQCTGLSASMLFFMLKFLDVALLRVRADWRSYVACALIVVIIHVGVLDPEPGRDMWLACSPLLSLTLLVGRASWVRRGLDAMTAGLQTAFSRGFSHLRVRGTVWLDQTRSHCWVLASPTCIPRSPPA